ncbi:PhzF family phenazine biosynthesis protein [Shewanella sp. KT0246]|uniref:PhzF family phenazine biosynthesis protein n=1 Tax=Shewanella sp. KT0246 TaxID=2815912 RepID=UPI001BC39622|nr:PhzF family phenazine biosynthesis protein [Shewanella sp. KT0246]GIU50155.1 putative isomerase [Shewanella sp. KT0246]
MTEKSLFNQFIRQVFSGDTQAGNPAAVEICSSRVVFENESLMQKRAAENRLPISAFIFKESIHTELGYHIRWFSPETEVILCGHGTLAAADVIISELNTDINLSQCSFLNKHITVKSSPNSSYTLELAPVELIASRLSSDLAEVIANHICLDAMTKYEVVVDNLTLLDKAKQTTSFNGYLIVPLASKEAVVNFDFDEKKFSELTQQALIVTYQAANKNEMFFRYFSPQYGAKEDSATGSAAPVIAEFWQFEYGVKYTCVQLSLFGGIYQVIRNTNKISVIAKVC